MNENNLYQEVFSRIEVFFYKAMLSGWVSDADGTKAQKSEQMPGVIFYHSQEVITSNKRELTFELCDSYVNDGQTGIFAGTTVITINGSPVWFMQYSGKYPPTASTVLRKALRSAYQSGSFCGGRGIDCTEDRESGLLYRCILKRNKFTDFCGSERVLDIHDAKNYQQIGELEFSGRSLIHDLK